MMVFQSTLPRGSDSSDLPGNVFPKNFNPRSLAGATDCKVFFTSDIIISIHAPSRERLVMSSYMDGIKSISIHAPSRERPSKVIYVIIHNNFNPRSLAGATLRSSNKCLNRFISIHAPSRERPHQNKLLLYSFKSSIFCELAQLKYSKIYFDVRKLIVSHSSLSCEPKLNFMFHITSHHEPKLHKR